MNKTVQTMFLACCLTVSAQTVPLRWAAELGDARPARFTLVRGDTVELAADLFAEGRPYLPATTDAALLWQTNGMGALWWEVPASVASNRVTATWTPAMDCGSSSYLAHFRVGSSTGSVFRAYARLAMQHGPGDPVNALPLPVPVLDFAKVVVTNAPWGAGGLDGGAVTNIVDGILTGATNGMVKVDSLGDVEIPNALLASAINIATDSLYSDSATVFYGDTEQTHDFRYELAVKGDLAPYAKTNDLGTAAYKDASEFATAADEALIYQLITNRMTGITFDFSTVAGLYLAISNIVAAQGGAITNFPAIP